MARATLAGRGPLLRAEHGDEATVVAGGSFLGIVMNQKLFAPTRLVALRSVPQLDYIEADGEKLMLGAMTTHRAVERSPVVRRAGLRWPSPSPSSPARASGTRRPWAGSSPTRTTPPIPSMLAALEAQVVARSVRGEREIPMDEFVLDHYETALEEDELVTELRIPRSEGTSVYRKFRSRSSEDRPCVSVAAAQDNGALRVVVVAGRQPQYFPEICTLARESA